MRWSNYFTIAPSTSRALLAFFVVTALITYASAAEEKIRGKYLGAKKTEHPAWFKESFLDFEQDVNEAAAEGKRVILYVYQDGCPYCNRLVKYNFGQKDIVEKTRKHFDFISLNMWGDREIATVGGKSMSEKEFARAIGVRYTPTMLFFDEQTQVVLRINGYYPPHNLRIALDYVAGHKEKEVTYRDFFTSRHPIPASGKLNSEPFFQKPPYVLARNSVPASRPLAVFFEQKQCENCDTLHQKVLTKPKTRELIQKFDVVQLDMWSDTPVVTPDNKRMTARDWVKALNINYAPSVVVFDENGKEVMRTDAYLRNFHFQSLLDYVLKRAYKTEPEFQRFLQHRAEKMIEKGIDVDIWN